MIGVGDTLPEFEVVGVKPGFNDPEENGTSAFEAINNASFAGKWKIIYFYPKDFTFVCPTEIVAFAELNDDFDARGAVVMGGSTDNEFCKLAWRRDHSDLNKLNQWGFADNGGVFMDALGIRATGDNVALRATFIVDAENVVQHISVNPLSVGRNPEETLRILDAIQTGVNCGCNREVGGDVL